MAATGREGDGFGHPRGLREVIPNQTRFRKHKEFVVPTGGRLSTLQVNILILLISIDLCFKIYTESIMYPNPKSGNLSKLLYEIVPEAISKADTNLNRSYS